MHNIKQEDIANIIDNYVKYYNDNKLINKHLAWIADIFSLAGKEYLTESHRLAIEQVVEKWNKNHDQTISYDKKSESLELN